MASKARAIIKTYIVHGDRLGLTVFRIRDAIF